MYIHMFECAPHACVRQRLCTCVFAGVFVSVCTCASVSVCIRTQEGWGSVGSGKHVVWQKIKHKNDRWGKGLSRRGAVGREGGGLNPVKAAHDVGEDVTETESHAVCVCVCERISQSVPWAHTTNKLKVGEGHPIRTQHT